MSEEARQESGGQASSSSMVLVVVLWALVLIPLLWGVYQTLRASSPCSQGDRRSVAGRTHARLFYSSILSLPGVDVEPASAQEADQRHAELPGDVDGEAARGGDGAHDGDARPSGTSAGSRSCCAR